MKKQLSLALLTINILGLNVLPAKAANTQIKQASINNTESAKSNESALLTDGEWCVEVPWMGFVCW